MANDDAKMAFLCGLSDANSPLSKLGGCALVGDTIYKFWQESLKKHITTTDKHCLHREISTST